MPKVLLADNDRHVSALLGEVLERRGLTVEFAFDGEHARRRVLAPELGVIVCDLDMPGMSGLEMLESLPAEASIAPVVVISGYLDGMLTARLASLPFVRRVMRKPFDLMSFAAAVQGLAEERGKQVAGRENAS